MSDWRKKAMWAAQAMRELSFDERDLLIAENYPKVLDLRPRLQGRMRGGFFA